MKVTKITLQLSGIDLASLKEKEIMEQIEKHYEALGVETSEIGEVNIYINIEGTAVTAYFTSEHSTGSIRLN